MSRFLDGIERVGNMVPHPVVIFLILIAAVIVLSAVLSLFGATVSFERINPETNEIEIATAGADLKENAFSRRPAVEASERFCRNCEPPAMIVP